MIPEYGPVKLVYLQTASFCNLDCSYCYIPKENRKKQEFLSMELARIVFKKLFMSPILYSDFGLYFNGNEPLVLPVSYYEELFSVLKQVEAEHNLKNLNIRFLIQTNGTLITPEWCNFLRKNNVNVAVSLDGPAFLHDAHRKSIEGDNTHEQVMTGIRLLQEYQVDFFINCILTRRTLEHPGALYQFFIENDIHQIHFKLEEKTDSETDSSLKYDGIEEQYRYFMSMFWDLNRISGGKIHLVDFEKALEKIDQPSDKRVNNSTNKPFEFVNVDYQGNFSTYSPELLTMISPEYGNFILGNFSETTLESAYKHEKFQALKQDIDAGTRSCEVICEFMNYCNGGSPRVKYTENRTFNSTETLVCRLKEKVLLDLIVEKLEYHARKYEYHYSE